MSQTSGLCLRLKQMITNRKILLLATLSLFVGCGDKGSSTESSSCQAPRGSHSGCCSHHGGWTNRCGGGQAAYGVDSGRLVCDDGTFSPSCTYSVKPVEEMLFDYQNKYSVE